MNWNSLEPNCHAFRVLKIIKFGFFHEQSPTAYTVSWLEWKLWQSKTGTTLNNKQYEVLIYYFGVSSFPISVTLLAFDHKRKGKLLAYQGTVFRHKAIGSHLKLSSSTPFPKSSVVILLSGINGRYYLLLCSVCLFGWFRGWLFLFFFFLAQ